MASVKTMAGSTRSAQRIFLYGFILMSLMARAQFTPGNLVLLQAGDGSVPLASTGNPLFLKEYTPAGIAAFSVAIPTASNPLIIGGSATSEGGLSLSPNGKYLVFAGYATAPPYSSALSGSSASVVKRCIGIVDAAGSYTRVATPGFFTGTNIRSACADGISNYWGAGGNDGTCYFGTGSPTVAVQNAVTNTRELAIFSSNLYFSTGSGTQGIYKVSGLPVTSGQTTSLVINTSTTGSGTPGPFAFYFNAAQTICYVADDRTPANGGGIQKWIYNAGAWTLAYTLSTGAAYGARGVAADFSGADPKVYATTSEGSLNRLIAINDAGAGATATLLATAAANTIFRGLAFAPFCSAPQINAISSTGTVCATRAFTLNANLSGTAPFTYTWTGPNTFFSAIQNPTLLAQASGSYALSVANGCGAATFSGNIAVHPLPVLSLNSSTICPGGTASLTASGAATYSWSTGDLAANIQVSPVSTASYAVLATSGQGCAVTGSTSVLVTNVLSLSVNSTSTCLGSAVTLSASGATSYTWSTSANAYSITINPAATTVYTLVGSASGCAASASAAATVIVKPLPIIVVNSPTICAGSIATLSATGAASYSWSTGGTAASLLLNLTAGTVYTLTGFSSAGCTATMQAFVTVNALPQVSFGTIGNNFCVSDPTVALAGSPQNGTYTGNGISGNTFDPTAVAAGTFVLSYAYSDANGCAATDSRTVSISACTALGKNFIALKIEVYPNPAHEFLNLLSPVGNLPVEIYNAPGIKTDAFIMPGPKMLLDLSAYANGVYLIKTKYGIVKFIKE